MSQPLLHQFDTRTLRNRGIIQKNHCSSVSLCCYLAVIILRCPQLLIPPRSFHPRRHLNEKHHPLTTISVWLRGKSLLGKHLIRQAASFINVFPAGVKAPKMTSVHNKTFFSHFKSLYLWVYSDLNDTGLIDSEVLRTVMCRCWSVLPTPNVSISSKDQYLY